ncbi:glycosyltransferase family 1 protein [Pseudomonas cavernae]|uniref:Glycosyltransferase family 1 protein n=1 Tax=Pseudomonas cavernae TaxID=2320867 RepID=A0A385YYQ5_9PSED|nr:glycosyltransferase [Pseudomonas cavernae]AYC31460.1 glycosyltransferase family 1 protein [Pseudomonas cavernae]
MSNTALFINYCGIPGGAERRFARTFLAIQGKNKNVFLIINKHGREALEKKGITLGKKNILQTDSTKEKKEKILDKILTLASTWLIIKKNKIHHVHYPVDPSIYTFAHSFLVRILNVSYSLSIVDSSRVSKNDLSFLQKIIWKRSIKKASRLDILSDGIHANITKIFGKLPSWEISPCSFTDYSKSHKGSTRRDFNFVMMSRFTQGKGYELLFDALEYIKKNRPLDINKIGKIGLFGDGPLNTYIAKRVQDNKEFKIQISYTDNPFEVFSKSNFFLSLQKSENYPSQSILEAMSCGAIVIATDVGETYKIVPDGIGYRVNPTPKSLALTMIDFADKHDNRAEMSNASIDFVKKTHTISRFSTYLDNFLRDASR